MTLGESIRGGVKWLLAGNLGNQISQFIFGVILARLLLPEDFGLLVTIQVFTGLVGLVSGGGMGQALVRSKEATEHDFNVVFTLQIFFGILIYLGFYLAAPLIADAFGNPLYQDLVRVSAISFLIRPFVNTRASWLHREMRFKQSALIGLAVGIVTGIASIVMAQYGMGVWSLTFAGILGSLISLALLDRFTERRPSLVINMDTARKFGSYGLKVSLNDIASYFTKQVSNTIISRVSGPSAVGLFNKGESLAWLPFSTVSASVYDAVFRGMAKVQDNPDQTKYLFFRMMSLMTLYTLPFYIGLAWMAEPFMLFVYGAKWLPAADPLRIVSLAGLFICIGHPCGAVLAAQNRLGREVWVHITQGIIVAVACYFGLKAWGIAGAALGIFLGVAYSTPVMYYLATRCFPSSFADLLHALAPGLKLNAALLITLTIIHSLLPAGMRETHPALYMIVAGGGGAVIYAATFLFFPSASLQAEAQRWRKLLHLAA